MHTISIWDNNSQRLMRIEASLRQAMKTLAIDAKVQLNSELPLLKRNGLHAKVPVIQVDNGDFWNHKIDEDIPLDILILLLETMQNRGIL